MFYPAAFGQHSPTAYQLAPAGAAVAGALVGFGTRVGCGCTSGHGLCGLSRRSMRSLSAVVTFMFSGGVTVYLTRTYAVSSEALSWMFQNVSAASVGSSGFMADTAGGVVDLNSLLKAAALLFGSAYVSRKMILSSSGQAHNSIAGINATLNSNSRKVGYDTVNTPSLTTHFVSFGCGALFALCLGYSGMTDPQRVSAFLDVTSPSGWDPSLMGVMGGGVLVNLLTFEFMRKDEKTKMSKYAFGLDPRNMGLDGRLLSGAAIFGMGWGIGGMCPGPALASIFDFSGPTLYFLPAMLLGMGCSALV